MYRLTFLLFIEFSSGQLLQRLALIINNEEFVNEVADPRTGSDFDLKNLRNLFLDNLQFTVTSRKNLSYPDLMEEILRFAGKDEHDEADMAAVVVMSHGKEGAVCCSDGQLLETEWIMKQFNNSGCPSLRGKPKFFMFQSCRGDEEDGGVSATASDSLEMRDVSWEDIIIAYSTIRGYVASRDSRHGSWFVQSFGECQARLRLETHTNFKRMFGRK